MNARSRIGTAPRWGVDGLAPARALRAFGMRRSGNHAIADWLLRNAEGSGTVFFNNCIPGRSPVRSFRTLAVNRSRKPTKQAMHDLAGTCAAAGPTPTVLVTYEDTPPNGRRGRPISGDLDAAFDADIIIYRSFLNWSASLLKKLQRNDGYSRAHRAAIVLKAVDSYTRMLTLLTDADELRLIPICYDDWMASSEYRLSRLSALNLTARDNSPGDVQPYGGGSSFQEDTVSARDLASDRRFDQMGDDPDFYDLMAISARDSRLMTQIERHFPRDAARLTVYARTGRTGDE